MNAAMSATLQLQQCSRQGSHYPHLHKPRCCSRRWAMRQHRSTKMHSIQSPSQVTSKTQSAIPVVAAPDALQRWDAEADIVKQHISTVTVRPAKVQLHHIHTPFTALFAYMAVLAMLATSSDWYLDLACFGSVWAGLWALCCRLQPAPRTVVLLTLLPLSHLSGSLGTYHWELGNLSWDILVHISNGFIGTLLFASCIADWTSAAQAAGQQSKQQDERAARLAANTSSTTADAQDGPMAGAALQHDSSSGSWRRNMLAVLQLSGLLIAGTSLIEVVEAFGGHVAGHTGEGMFLRGAGDFCTASLPCSEEVDTAKDMADNITGMMLALVALATGRGSGTVSGKG